MSLADRPAVATFPLIGGDSVDFRINPEERTRFKRCRRQWDFASPHRRDLEPVGAAEPALPAALHEALAVYYYPGTWDWPHDLTQSLVHKAMERSLREAGAPGELAVGAALLDCYDAWASSVDDFAPVKINHDAHALVPDPSDPERGLTTPGGSPVVYSCQVDLVAADTGDEYWVVCHHIVEDWQDLATLLRDEAAVAACWAWEQDFMGMTITGTIHNEVRITGPLKLPSDTDRAPHGGRKSVAQNEPSGGGRSFPQHIRMSAQAARSGGTSRTEQYTAGVLRRTRIRRSRNEIAAVPMLLAAEAQDMTGSPVVYPTPAAHCASCEFSDPCLVMSGGADPEPLLEKNFRRHPAETTPKPKLGQSTWGFGRGAAPPDWSADTGGPAPDR
jgi:hypothetical protein